MTDPIISVSNLTKKYHKADKKAVDNISFDVTPGEFFCLLGPNGAGKTTTISILTTTLQKTSGTITIAGFDLDKQESLVRKNIGIIFQNPSLDQNLTAEENVRFHSVLYGVYPFRPLFSLMPKEYQEKVLHLSEVLGIKKQIFSPIKTFSGGMKRKLEILRSLIHNPKILFLDEPTSGLDPLSRKNLWEYLKEVRETQKITIFLTTHYLEEAEGADRVCIINDGKIISLGTPTQIKKHLVQDYLLMNSKTPTKLEEELTKKKISFEKKSNYYQIALNNQSAQSVIQQIKTPLSTLKIHDPSLEEAYLEIIKEDNNITE
jgi:ABC-2 type transport system ATP-binding protein